MGRDTKIEWCDHSHNFWYGCTEVSPACDHCYARVMMDERYAKVKWGAGQPRVRTSPKNWNEPLRWNRAAAAAGKVETVFCLSLGDIWDNEVPDEWRWEAFDVMRQCPNLLFLLLSKRIGNAMNMAQHRHAPPRKDMTTLPPNAALGATMVNQEEWDRDLSKLRHAGDTLGAKFTFASVEPMLGPIEIMLKTAQWPDWVIVGGESGPHARPMHPAWPRQLRDALGVIGVPLLFKQHGEWIGVPDLRRLPGGSGPGFGKFDHCEYDQQHESVRVGKKAAGRLLDGIEHNAKPA